MSAAGIEFGRYRLIRKLAAGGMAEIFLAHLDGPAGFDKEVVVKRLFPHYAANSAVLRLFQDEARVAADLNHPNVAHIYELGCTDGQWYIAMEHVPGRDLTEVCRRGVRARDFLPLAHSVRIVCQVCEGLHYVHTKVDRAGVPLGLVHRDVTPANLLLTFDGIVKILDFGIARTAARPDTDPGALKGTLAYMSPEQVRGEPVDARSDLFSLGVILYELTLGTRLFRGTETEIMRRITEDTIPNPRARDPRFPAELEQIVMRALEKDRNQRYPNVATLQWDLEDFCARRGLHSNAVRLAQYLRKLFGYIPAYEERGLVPQPALEPPPSAIVLASDGRQELGDDYDRTAERPALVVMDGAEPAQPADAELHQAEPGPVSDGAQFSLDLDEGDGEAAFLVRLERMMEAEARALREAVSSGANREDSGAVERQSAEPAEANPAPKPEEPAL
ncbi:MAG: serine/threonine protein kinase [Deltaproteobacteria bacterium]|nr:serine/threonine protein kinase [Deltaproteobacteria bacterium]